MALEHNVVGWFEIPVLDMERAISFYQAVFGFELGRHNLGPLDMAWFPSIEGSIGSPGSLVYAPQHYKPSADGILIYFTSPSGDIIVELDRVESAGGKLLQGKTLISDDIGYMGIFLDTEGNRIALHSSK
jgi:uncharacterized protein